MVSLEQRWWEAVSGGLDLHGAGAGEDGAVSHGQRLLLAEEMG